MKLNKILIFFLIFTLAGVDVCGQAELENKVIASLLRKGNMLIPEYKNTKRKGRVKSFNRKKVPPFVLLNVTKSPIREAVFDTLAMFERQVLKTEDRPMLHDFCSRNATRLSIDTIGALVRQITYIGSKEQKTVFKEKDNWHAYYLKYNLKPYVQVSRPGFNERKNKAMIYLTYSLGQNDESGYFMVLKKSWGKWRLKGNMLVWIK